MSLLLQPNYQLVDELVLEALYKRNGAKDFNAAEARQGFRLADLVDDDRSSYSAGTDAKHFGSVARLLMRLVYELNVNASLPRPRDLDPKGVFVVDIVHRAWSDGRTVYLAVRAGGPPVLMPLPELPSHLFDGTGTLADTRDAMRGFARDMADLVNLALPVARSLAEEAGRFQAPTDAR